jgi:hypothetical protein
MSLLMDALKKAEEEKKQAAKRLQEVEMESHDSTIENEVVDNQDAVIEESAVPEIFTETAQFSLEPLSLEEKLEDSKEFVAEDNATNSMEELTLKDASSHSEDMTLENTVLEDVNLQEKFDETQKEIDLNDTTVIEGLSTENASAPFDDTFHGVVFEEEEPETDIYEETLPGIPADQLFKDLGGGQFQPTPVAAKTVFSAGANTTKKKSTFKWGVMAVLALLAAGSFAIFYYFTITPVSRQLPSPLVARGIEFSGVESGPIPMPPIVEQVVEAEPRVTKNVIASIQEDSETQTTDELMESQNVSSEKEISVTEAKEESIETTPEMELINNKNDVEVAAVEELITNETSGKKKEPVVDVETNNENLNMDSTIASLEEKDNVRMDATLIDISKRKKFKQENEMLSQAFRAYQDGHYDAAKSIYNGVLKSEPDNRDAHLGLGAIAISQHDRKNAYSHYVHLLELNPLDTLAMSSLIALSNSADPVKDESAIKVLLQRDDEIVPRQHHVDQLA